MRGNIFKFEEPPFLDRLPELTYHLLKNIDSNFKFSLTYNDVVYDNFAFYSYGTKYGVFLPVNYFDGRVEFNIDNFDFFITFIEPFYYDIMTLYRSIVMYNPNLYKIYFESNVDDDIIYAIWVRSYNYFYYNQAMNGIYSNIFYNYKKEFDTDVDFKVKIFVRERTNIKVFTNVANIYTEFASMDDMFDYPLEIMLADMKEDFIEIELPAFMFENKTVYYRAHSLTNLVDNIAKGIAAWMH